jgi:hypothetical protein
MKPRLQRWALSLAAACAAAACADRLPTEPEPTVSSRSSLASGSSGDVVRILKRTESLSGNLTASGVIGPRGGHLGIDEAGVRVEFPRGAVKTPTLITITAVRGRNVAYTFEPHGIAFHKPVSIRQSLRNTAAWKDAALAAELQGAYFERLLVDRTQSYSRVLEHRGGKVKALGRVLEFSIEHFSGYMVSTGKLPSVDIETDVEISTR